MFDDPFFTQSMTPQVMKTDVLEKDGQYLLDIELPGYNKEDVQAELKDGILKVAIKKPEAKQIEDQKKLIPIK